MVQVQEQEQERQVRAPLIQAQQPEKPEYLTVLDGEHRIVIPQGDGKSDPYLVTSATFKPDGRVECFVEEDCKIYQQDAKYAWLARLDKAGNAVMPSQAWQDTCSSDDTSGMVFLVKTKKYGLLEFDFMKIQSDENWTWCTYANSRRPSFGHVYTPQVLRYKVKTCCGPVVADFMGDSNGVYTYKIIKGVRNRHRNRGTRKAQRTLAEKTKQEAEKEAKPAPVG
jgi:hypothetical protein